MSNNIKMVDAEGVEVNSSPQTEMGARGSTMGQNGVFETTVANALGIDESRELGQYRQEVSDIIKYAKSQLDEGEELTQEKLAWIVRDLDMRIGASPFAEKRIHKVARFIVLNRQKANIEKELESYREH